MGGILIDPTMIQLATDGAQFSVYGIPCVAANYTKTVLPILLSVWAMSYIERFFRKYVPDTLSTVFAPFLTMVVAVPVSLCALALLVHGPVMPSPPVLSSLVLPVVSPPSSEEVFWRVFGAQ